MKVYVIRRNNGTYYKRYFENYVQFEEEIAFAEIYTMKSGAENTMDFITRNKYKFNILSEELSVVEFSLIETTGLVDYTKQVRKEVVQEIRNKLKENGLLYTWKGKPKYKTMEELLNQLQGEDNGKD